MEFCACLTQPGLFYFMAKRQAAVTAGLDVIKKY